MLVVLGVHTSVTANVRQAIVLGRIGPPIRADTHIVVVASARRQDTA